MDVSLMTSAPPADVLREAGAVYQAAFAQPPYGETAEMAEAFTARVQRYARERDGFRLVVAQDDDGQMIALGLAVLARPGDWWRDQVAAAIDDSLAAQWLGELCLEVVHLAVTPEASQASPMFTVSWPPTAGTGAPAGMPACSSRPATAIPPVKWRPSADTTALATNRRPSRLTNQVSEPMPPLCTLT